MKASFIALSAALLGCIGDPPRGSPLYPATEPMPGRGDVARLSGYVKSVDGRDLSLLRPPFELLPGCHVILTPSHWGSVASDKASGVMATTGTIQFILRMKAGASYSVGVEMDETSGPTGRIHVRAYERDPKGKNTHTFRAASGQWDIERCGPATAGDEPDGDE